MNDKENLARAMYDTYCEAVGGKAWNGQPLPGSGEFFADPAKKVQADGWRAAAATATDHINRKEHTMTEEQKNEVKGKVHDAATTGAQKAAAAAKTATGWKKWAWVALAVALAGVAVFTQVQCTGMTPEQAQQIHAAHELYHRVSGRPCVLVLPVEDCKK